MSPVTSAKYLRRVMKSSKENIDLHNRLIFRRGASDTLRYHNIEFTGFSNYIAKYHITASIVSQKYHDDSELILCN